MHIIGIIIAILAFVGIWYWRVKAASNVVSEVGDAAGRLKGAYNRRKFRGKVQGATLTGIEDPKLAAAVLLVSVVEAGRPVSTDDEAFVTNWLRDAVREEKPEEAVVFARWASREVVDVNEVIRRLLPLFKSSLGPVERDQLIDAASEAAKRTGKAEPAQVEALRRLRNALVPDAVRERAF